MSLRKKLGKLLLLGMLEIGALAGAPIRPEEIEKLMDVMNRTRIVRIEKTKEPGRKPLPEADP